MLSFHDNGWLPLLQLIKMGVQNDCETINWMEMTMKIVGVTKVINEVNIQLEPHMKYIEEILYPRIVKLKEDSAKYDRLEETLTSRQKKELMSIGYTEMNTIQRLIIYGNGM